MELKEMKDIAANKMIEIVQDLDLAEYELKIIAIHGAYILRQCVEEIHDKLKEQ